MNKLTISPERYEYLNKKGNLKELYKRIESESGLNDTKLIYNIINKVSMYLDESDNIVFRLYYFHDLSIVEIKYKTGIHSFKRIEEKIENAISIIIVVCSKYNESRKDK